MTLVGGDLLRAWELGSARHPIDRALTLLWAAAPDEAEALPRLSLGERDARLLALHRATFGDRMDCLANCPRCGATVELALSSDALHQPTADLPALVRHDGIDIVVRSLDSRDLAAAAEAPDQDAAERLLFERAVVSASGAGGELSPTALPEGARAAVADLLAARDAAADIELRLACTECGAQWDAVLDVGRFVWTEVESEARRLLTEVGLLARSYGWSEAAILDMSAYRRRFYLELSGGI
jgi:hypothetical protein